MVLKVYFIHNWFLVRNLLRKSQENIQNPIYPNPKNQAHEG